MSETQAASSPAEVEDVFRGENVSLSEFSKYRQDGELPARFKPAETEAAAAPADAPEETVESEDEESKIASESETEEETQEPPQKGAEKRIKQLLAKIKELEKNATPKQDAPTESSPAKVEPQYTRQKPTADDKDKDGKPKYSTYEDFVEDLADWKAEQRIEAARREQAQQEAQKALKTTMDEARSRYEDADEVIFPAAKSVHDAKIPQVVKEVFEQSDSYIDLCYVVGSDPDELKKFISLAQANPRAAIGKVFEYENGIREELSKSSTPRDDKGKFTAPEVKKTSAPKPPSPVGGASSRAFDVSDESLSPEEWARKRTADLQKRGR